MQEHDPDSEKPRIILPPGVSYPAKDDGPADDEAPGADEDGLDVAAQLAQEQERSAQLARDLLLMRAEFENFRKRLRRTTDERVRFASQPLIADLLGTVDDLERALAAASDTADEPLRDGVALVHEAFMGALQTHGATAIEALDQPFDPALHEAVSVIETDNVPHDTVIEVTARGYTLHDRVIRATKVIVSRHTDPATRIAPASAELKACEGNDKEDEEEDADGATPE